MSNLNRIVQSPLFQPVAGCILFVAALAPLGGGPFAVYLATQVLIMGLFSMSFNMLFGYTGMLSFGHAAFFGVGAYAAALSLTKAGAGLFTAMILSVVVTLLAAAVIGFFSIKRTGIYFSMLTLAFGQMVHAIAFKWYSFTGGDNGIQGIPVPAISIGGFSIDMADPRNFYVLVVIVAAISIAVLRLIVVSPFGLTLRCIRENPDRTTFVGNSVMRYQWFIFLLASVFAGVAGGLWAGFQRYVSPDVIYWTISAEAVLMAVLGGSRTFFGPLIGAAIFVLLNDFITSQTHYWSAFMGAVLLVLVLFLPGGILGTLLRFVSRKPRAVPGSAERVGV